MACDGVILIVLVIVRFNFVRHKGTMSSVHRNTPDQRGETGGGARRGRRSQPIRGERRRRFEVCFRVTPRDEGSRTSPGFFRNLNDVVFADCDTPVFIITSRKTPCQCRRATSRASKIYFVSTPSLETVGARGIIHMIEQSYVSCLIPGITLLPRIIPQMTRRKERPRHCMTNYWRHVCQCEILILAI